MSINRYKRYPYNLQKPFSFMSVFDNIKKGSLHRELGIPEDEKIPGGKRKMQQLCHAPIGEQIIIAGREVTVNAHMKKQGCFAANFGYRKH
jgi:hypothetical protein